MKLSVIIVNYNVEYFLEQCLLSVQKALRNIESEVFVVDNNSRDGSVAMVREKFPDVLLIANEDNPGFARANNQALRKARGTYQLLLNPDTVVEENTFELALQFMDQHPRAGGLGIKMIDGRGQYLPESKRGLPTPQVAFYKMVGLTRLFPRSRRFARYYLGHLSEQENQKVEILAGAFMLLRRETLAEVGLLDEDYFMYGEDIDLSYRILKAGYENYYLADSQIIHYKGESTKKGSLNYVLIFYRAMAIFARKHFSNRYVQVFHAVIYLAIALRAMVSVLRRGLNQLFPPLIDAGICISGLYFITRYWEQNHRFIKGGAYDRDLLLIAFPAYTLLWLGGMLLYGAYRRPAHIAALLKGVTMGTIALLVLYSLLPEAFRFSRAILLLGSVFAFFALPGWRYLFGLITRVPLLRSTARPKRILIAGSLPEVERVHHLIRHAGQPASFTGYLSVNEPSAEERPSYSGRLDQLADLVPLLQIDEVVFCSQDISSKHIFEWMSRLQKLPVELKIAPPESHFIIGSNSIQNQGSWYALELNTIAQPANVRAKRLHDLLMSFTALLLSPLLWPVNRFRILYFRRVIAVLPAQATWIGYHQQGASQHLPKLKKAIFPCTALKPHSQVDRETCTRLNELYAKDYYPTMDWLLLCKNWRRLGAP